MIFGDRSLSDHFVLYWHDPSEGVVILAGLRVEEFNGKIKGFPLAHTNGKEQIRDRPSRSSFESLGKELRMPPAQIMRPLASHPERIGFPLDFSVSKVRGTGFCQMEIDKQLTSSQNSAPKTP